MNPLEGDDDGLKKYGPPYRLYRNSAAGNLKIL
jgi:hypothetical protein